jgi:thiamine biosynthesis protein ThiS
MIVNGERVAYREGLTLHDLLADLRIDQRRVAIMVGDEIYHAGKVPNAPLADQDVVEIVTMQQGG